MSQPNVKRCSPRAAASLSLIAAGLLASVAVRLTAATLPGPDEAAQLDLGRSLFRTQWTAADVDNSSTPGTVQRKGLGPLFVAASCDTCHNGGAGGRGPTGDGQTPIALEIQLESPGADVEGEDSGDPVYGRVFNTSAVQGAQAEGTATVRYTETYGYYYPDGTRWRMRAPHYRLTGLTRGALTPTTIIKPRLAPALMGVALLEKIPESAIIGETSDSRTRDLATGVPAWHLRGGTRMLGRFGWQGDTVSVRDQTTKALAGEMGLTSPDRPDDDCTASETDCLSLPHGGPPEVSEELVQALVAFQRTFAVRRLPTDGEDNSLGAELFRASGCAVCHKTRITLESALIAPYTDLRLHDLGREMADETVSGAKVRSRWRTAPLWGLGYRITTEGHPTLLHDGRARSAEEAILWHSGEAARARRNFVNLGPRSRRALLQWVESR